MARVSAFVELTFEGPLARLTLKRADKLNALDRAMIDALADAARAIDASRDARVAILSGEGKAFCAGGDIAAWGGLPALEMWRDWTRAGHRAFEALARLRVPLIAALTGHAFGGGLELAAVAADIRDRRERNQARPPRSRVSAWRRAGPARNGSCAASALRSCAAWRLGGATFSAEEGCALGGLVDEVTGRGRRAALPKHPRRLPPISPGAAAALAQMVEGDDQCRRRRGSRRADRGPRRRADRVPPRIWPGRAAVPRQARARFRSAAKGESR